MSKCLVILLFLYTKSQDKFLCPKGNSKVLQGYCTLLYHFISKQTDRDRKAADREKETDRLDSPLVKHGSFIDLQTSLRESRITDCRYRLTKINFLISSGKNRTQH